MKTKSVLGSCILALLAVASVAAYAQMTTTEIANAQNAERVVDAEGNLRVPADYRTAYQFLGSWAVAAADLVPENIRSKSLIQPSPIPPTLKRRGRPPKSGGLDQNDG